MALSPRKTQSSVADTLLSGPREMNDDNKRLIRERINDAAKNLKGKLGGSHASRFFKFKIPPLSE